MIRQTVLPQSLSRLINELSKLPSVGEKSATRLAYYILKRGIGDSRRLADAIMDASQRIGMCERCFGFSEEALCPICTEKGRSQNLICVVEKPADVVAMERSGAFSGTYHVLHGLWSPLRGVQPDELKIAELIERVRRGEEPGGDQIEEITGATVEGDATALYIAEAVSPFSTKVTRLAQGMSKGSDLEYTDEVTLNQALAGRRNIG
jgi:recombination protein RecR